MPRPLSRRRLLQWAGAGAAAEALLGPLESWAQGTSGGLRFGPEEFPDFTEFYISPAAVADSPVEVYALLNGPSVTGAYHFSLTRAEGVVMEVEKNLFLRQAVERLGLAPLTAMYWYCEGSRPYRTDWRPRSTIPTAWLSGPATASASGVR